jgi:hypothetical protein
MVYCAVQVVSSGVAGLALLVLLAKPGVHNTVLVLVVVPEAWLVL